MRPRWTRRDMARLLGAGALTLWAAPGASRSPRRRLVLIELKGGNDGLNTLVPHRHDRYKSLRPGLALGDDEVVTSARLSDMALHKGMSALMPALEGGDLAIVQGLGYPAPNRSHFRSIAIWHSASDANRTRSEGWLSALQPEGDALFAVNLGTDERGPLTGVHSMLTLPTRGRLYVPPAPKATATGRSPALAHVVDTERRLASVIGQVIAADAQGRRKVAPDAFPRGKLGQSLSQVASLLVGGAGQVFRVQHAGFDTHKNQRNIHARLLTELSESLSVLRSVLKQAGLYDDVLIATYSEFGRRVAQNRSGGTDHGTAAPHFVMGGGVRGGLYGDAPSLHDLDNGDLKFTVDYRRLYRTAGEWLDAPSSRLDGVLGRHRALSILG